MKVAFFVFEFHSLNRNCTRIGDSSLRNRMHCSHKYHNTNRYVLLSKQFLTPTIALFLVRSKREVSIVSIPYIWAIFLYSPICGGHFVHQVHKFHAVVSGLHPVAPGMMKERRTTHLIRANTLPLQCGISFMRFQSDCLC